MHSETLYLPAAAHALMSISLLTEKLSLSSQSFAGANLVYLTLGRASLMCLMHLSDRVKERGRIGSHCRSAGLWLPKEPVARLRDSNKEVPE